MSMPRSSSSHELPSLKLSRFGLPWTDREISTFVQLYNPQLLFLFETKKKSTDMEIFRVRWSYDCCLSIDYVGKSGGLSLLWLSETILQIILIPLSLMTKGDGVLLVSMAILRWGIVIYPGYCVF